MDPKQDVNLLILEEDFTTVAFIDVYESLSWSDRYQEAGEFELVVPATEQMLEYFRLDRILIANFSDRAMIVEEITTESTAQYGNRMIIKGRTLESILSRRIVWFRVNGTGKDQKVNLQDAIERILNENCISPSDGNRKIPRLHFRRSSDPNVTQHYLMEDHWGDDIYTLICNQCKGHNIGWRILPTFEGELYFELYYGVNRSWAQDKNPWVIFSPNYDNFLQSQYYISKEGYKTAVLGVGPKEAWKTVEYYPDQPPAIIEHVGDNFTVTVERDGHGGSGLQRRELAVDCTEFTSFPDEEEVTAEIRGTRIATRASLRESILAQMTRKSETALNDTSMTETFDGNAEFTDQFVYGRDFFMGDVVQLQNGFGMEEPARVSEVLFTYDMSGYNCVPTFIGVSDEISHKDSST